MTTPSTPTGPDVPREAGPVGGAAPGPATGAAGPSHPPAAAEPAGRHGGGSARRTGRGIGLTLAAALLVFVTVLLVLFVLFNTQTVQISLVFGDVQAPLVVALLVAAALGGLVVALGSLVGTIRRRNR